MGTISFELVHKETDELITKSNLLKDIWWYIKTQINEPRSYDVCEIEGGDVVDTADAYFLVENYKNEESLPQTITDISHF